MTALVWDLFDPGDDPGYILQPVILTASRVDDDDDEPEAPTIGSTKPKCRTCKDPNYSLDKDQCIACRICPR